ncbi:alpha/beta-hydrolase [Mycena olivaceomarginata]|nr:alpha/beta-hydrolase [Mycena olivaceomarginata]
MGQTRHNQVKTQRGFTYSYSASPAASGKPTLLFVHGFPAGSFLWRRQVAFFQKLGYGLIVPDLLGYGETDKPTDLTVYVGSGHAQDLVDILDAEGVEQVVAIGHDWGVMPVSRLINYHPERIAACSFLAGGYAPPLALGSDRISQHKQISRPFFVQPDAAAIIEEHIDSFISLVYPETIELWKERLCVDGAARAWIESNRIEPLPAYVTPEDREHFKNAFLNGGLSAPLCWYKAMIEKTTAEDDASADTYSFLLPRFYNYATESHWVFPEISPEAAEIKQPLLFVAFTGDCLSLPIFGDTTHAKYAKGKVTRKEIGAGHWGTESHAEELNGILHEWLRGLD